MNSKTFIARATAILLAVPILILIQAPNGSANLGGYDGNESPAVTSCTDKASTFPTFIHTKLKTSLKGTFSGFEIHLSGKDGDCSVILYSSSPSDK
jgi:hypothetical protein